VDGAGTELAPQRFQLLVAHARLEVVMGVHVGAERAGGREGGGQPDPLEHAPVDPPVAVCDGRLQDAGAESRARVWI
jgi:hypothetical protein